MIIVFSESHKNRSAYLDRLCGSYRMISCCTSQKRLHLRPQGCRRQNGWMGGRPTHLAKEKLLHCSNQWIAGFRIGHRNACARFSATFGLAAMEPSKFVGSFYGGFHTWGYPNSWIVFIRENPIEMDDLGVPPCVETTILLIVPEDPRATPSPEWWRAWHWEAWKMQRTWRWFPEIVGFSTINHPLWGTPILWKLPYVYSAV